MSASFRTCITLILAVAVLGIQLITVVFDYGNVDFYRKPLSVIWFVLTLVSMVKRSTTGFWANIRQCWPLQLAVPVLIFIVSGVLADIYKPYHPRIPKKVEQNKAPQTDAGGSLSPNLSSLARRGWA